MEKLTIATFILCCLNFVILLLIVVASIIAGKKIKKVVTKANDSVEKIKKAFEPLSNLFPKKESKPEKQIEIQP